jgi:predicted nucleic acid-binding protein
MSEDTSFYLDTAFLISLVVPEATSVASLQWINTCKGRLIVSDFARLEWADVTRRQNRRSSLSVEHARKGFRAFDEWLERFTHSLPCNPADIRRAEWLVRYGPLPVRAADALHLAACERAGATFVSYDKAARGVAATIGIPTLEPTAP